MRERIRHSSSLFMSEILTPQLSLPRMLGFSSKKDCSQSSVILTCGEGRKQFSLLLLVGNSLVMGHRIRNLRHNPAELIDKLHDTLQKFYESLSHLKTFGKGWTRRNEETREQARVMLKG